MARWWAGSFPRGERRGSRPPWFPIVLASILALAVPASHPDPAGAQVALGSAATLTVITAPVEVQRSVGPREAAPSGATVLVGDRIFTGLGGSARLTFFQGTEVEMAPETEVMLQEMTRRASGASIVSFGQAIGSTVARVAALVDPTSRVQVSTQSAVAVVRGTELEVTVTKEQVQTFRSTTGSFDVIAGGQVQRVTQGEVTVVPPPPPPAPTVRARTTETIGNAQVSIPGGSDRAPIRPVPEARVVELLATVAGVTAKVGTPVVVTPMPKAKALLDAAVGTPLPTAGPTIRMPVADDDQKGEPEKAQEALVETEAKMDADLGKDAKGPLGKPDEAEVPPEMVVATPGPARPVVVPTVSMPPMAQPKATDTPVPTALPRATDTPVPTAKPKPSDTPVPTATPRATDMPPPTATPRAIDTPVPTAMPRAIDTPVPTVQLQPPSAPKPPDAMVPAPASR